MNEMLDGLGAEDTITCWTIQKRAVWEQLQRRGRYWVPKRYVDADFRPAYDWLTRQQQARISGAVGRYPIWAYARITRTDLRINCRFMAQYHPSAVLLICHVPRSQVLLSEYDMWHVALNQGYVDQNDDPAAIDTWWDAAERRHNLVQARHPNTYPPALMAELEASWERIFDIAHWRNLYPDLYVQATFETLHLEHVVRAIPLRQAGSHTNRRIGAMVRYLEP